MSTWLWFILNIHGIPGSKFTSSQRGAFVVTILDFHVIRTKKCMVRIMSSERRNFTLFLPFYNLKSGFFAVNYND